MRLFRGAIGILAALKAIDLAATLPQETDGSVAYALLALWVAGALLLIIDRRPSLGAGAVAASGTAIIFTAPALAVPDGPTLAIYAGTMFALYWLFFDSAERPDEVEPCAPGVSSSGTTGEISGAGSARP